MTARIANYEDPFVRWIPPRAPSWRLSLLARPLPPLSRTSMDALAALLSERPPEQLSATELHSRIALLEDAARAYRAELESRTARLDALPDEIQQVIFGQMCNALDPRSAVAYSSASKRVEAARADAAGW